MILIGSIGLGVQKNTSDIDYACTIDEVPRTAIGMDEIPSGKDYISYDEDTILGISRPFNPIKVYKIGHIDYIVHTKDELVVINKAIKLLRKFPKFLFRAKKIRIVAYRLALYYYYKG